MWMQVVSAGAPCLVGVGGEGLFSWLNSPRTSFHVTKCLSSEALVTAVLLYLCDHLFDVGQDFKLSEDTARSAPADYCISGPTTVSDT